MSQIALFIKSKSRQGKRDEIFALYKEHLAPRAEANSGQEVVVWAADQHDPDSFYLFELYTNADELGVNAQAPWFGEYMEKVGPLLAGEPEVGMADPAWVKGA